MVSTTQLEPVANTFMLLANVLSAVKIDKLVVPEVVGSNSEDVIMECWYSGASDDVTVLWLHNGAKVYEWQRGQEPRVSGLLQGRLDLTYKSSSEGKCSLRIVELSPELSGEFACVVRSDGREARQDAALTVFSPEQDFELTFSSPLGSDTVNVECSAKHLYPQPELTIEYNKVPLWRQQQWSWREGARFSARAAGSLPHAALRPRADLTCRLQLPRVHYTAITKKYIHSDSIFNGENKIYPSYFIIACVILLIHVSK